MRFFSRSITASLSEWRFATASAASVSHFSVVSVISPCVPEPSGVKVKPGGPVPSVYFLIEEHIDFMSLQCNLYASGARNWWQQTHTLVKLQARLVD